MSVIHYLLSGAHHRENLEHTGVLTPSDAVIYPFNDLTNVTIKNLVIMFDEGVVQKPDEFRQWFNEQVLPKLSSATLVFTAREVESLRYGAIFTPSKDKKVAYICLDRTHSIELAKRGVIPENALVIYAMQNTLGLRFDRVVVTFALEIKNTDTFKDWFNYGVLARLLPSNLPLSDRVTILEGIFSYRDGYPKEVRDEHRTA